MKVSRRATRRLTLGDPAIVEAEEFAALLAEGHERGVLTFESVAAAVEEAEASREQVAELHAYLDEHGIELVSREETAEAESPVPGLKAELDLTVEPSLDSLRLYLRSIGRVALLTRRPRRSRSPSGSSAATSRPSSRWSRPTCAWSSRSRRATSAAGFRSST